MELNLELKLKLTTTSPVGGWWVDWNEINAKSTQVEVELEVGVELGKINLDSTKMNLDAI